jgi:hypothetical protein
MVSVYGPSLKSICLRSLLEEIVINQHFSLFNNLGQHLEQEASRTYSLSFSTPFIMLFTPFVSNDVDLLWCEDEFDVYIKLFDFSNFLQVYVETNHVDDVTNVKPSDDANATNVEVSNVIHDEVGDDVVILFLQFYNPTICLDIKNFVVRDFDPSNDHVSSDTIVCHQSPYDPKDDVSTFVYDSTPCFDFNFLIILLLIRYVKDPIF